MVTLVKTIEDVKELAKYLSENEKVFVHPDDDFNDYIDNKSRLPVYSQEDAEFRNQLIKKCFDICNQNKIDIYDIFLNAYCQK